MPILMYEEMIWNPELSGIQNYLTQVICIGPLDEINRWIHSLNCAMPGGQILGHNIEMMGFEIPTKIVTNG